MKDHAFSRRSFLGGCAAAGAGAVLAGCGAASSPAASSAASPAQSTASSAAPQTVELTVFAAASLTETLSAIGEQYTLDHPEVQFRFNFDSSGTLKTQIQEGAVCDLFISAGQKQMNQLDAAAEAEKNPDQLDFVQPGSRVDLLENKVTLTVPAENPKQIQSFEQLAEHLTAGDILFCMGNGDVPVGQYTQKILSYYGLDEQALAKAGVITYGSNVKEVTTQVKEASVDAGVVYCTDAFSAKLTVVDEAAAEMCGQVVYPAAVMRTAACPEQAQQFLDYLATEPAMDVFRSVGFVPVD